MAIERFKQQPLNYGRVSNEVADAQASISNALFSFGNRALGIAADDFRRDREAEEAKKRDELINQAEEEAAKQVRIATERLEQRKQGVDVESTPLPLREGNEEADRAYNNLLLASYYRGMVSDTNNRLEAVRIENPDDIGTYEANAREILQQTLGEVPENFRERFSLDVESAIGQKTNQVRSAQRTKELKDAVTDIESAANDYTNEALRGARFNDPGLMKEARDNYVATQKELFEGGLITEQQFTDRVEDFDESLNAEAQYGGLVEVLEVEGEESARQALLEWTRKDTGLSPKAKEEVTRRFSTFLSRFEKEAAKQVAEERARIAEEASVRTVNLEKDMLAGNLTQEELDQAWDGGKGFLSDSKYISMKRELMVQEEKQLKSIQYTNNVYSALDGGPPVDPNDKDQVKAVDEAFNRHTQNLQDPEQIISITAHYAKQTGVLPTQARSAIRGLQRSSNPEVVANAAKLYSAINDVAPQTLNDMSEKDKSMAAMVSAYMSAGADPVEAVEIATTNLGKSESERGILRTEYKALKKDNENELDSFIDDDFDGWFSTQPQAKQNIRADFDTLTEAYYQNTGDIEIARKAAWDDIKRSWGPSEVNGEKVMTRFPIEGKYGMSPEDTRIQINNGARTSSAIDFILKEEGGLVMDDAGAGVTNFGINSTANPEVDVLNLTRNQAAKIYQDKYWDSINADDLPPEMQLVAFDAAVNMGVGTAQKLLKKADTPEEFTRLRKEEYRKIAEKPGKEQYLKGWLARADRALKHALPEPMDMMVVSDHLTVRGQGRDYAVYTVDERGIIQPMRDENNNLVRYKPEPFRTKTAREERIKTEQKITQARLDRQERLAGVKNTEDFNRRSIIKNLESFGKGL